MPYVYPVKFFEENKRSELNWGAMLYALCTMLLALLTFNFY